jgi:hypothetical protein
MTVIKLMKKTPLTATQKTNIAKAVGDFVVHPKGSAIINAKGKMKVDAMGTAKIGVMDRNYKPKWSSISKYRPSKPNWRSMKKISGYKSSAVSRRTARQQYGRHMTRRR